MNIEQLFFDLYKAPVEAEVEKVLARHSLLDDPANWCPYGGNESNFGVVENQQASPIPALIEKITNGSDAILMRACLEHGIDPRSHQAPCAMDMSELAVHADLVSLSGHKMYGPQGIGALYIRRDVQGCVEPLIYGGGQQGGLRSGTVPLPLCVGMATAVELVRTPEGAEERRRLARQRDSFVRLLQSSRFSIAVNGPSSARRHPGNANLRFDGFSAQDILGSLQPRLAASTGAACTSGIPEPSHVLRALGLSEAEAESSIRFSFGRFTTDDEVEQAASFVVETLEALATAGIRQTAPEKAAKTALRRIRARGGLDDIFHRSAPDSRQKQP